MGFPKLSRKTSGANLGAALVGKHVGRFFLLEKLVRVTEVTIADKDSAVALPRSIIGRQVVRVRFERAGGSWRRNMT